METSIIAQQGVAKACHFHLGGADRVFLLIGRVKSSPALVFPRVRLGSCGRVNNPEEWNLQPERNLE